MSPYLTIAEAAELLRISEGTVRNKISGNVFREGVHYFKPPGMHPRFKRAALEAWIEGWEAKQLRGIRMAGGYILGSGR